MTRVLTQYIMVNHNLFLINFNPFSWDIISCSIFNHENVAKVHTSLLNLEIQTSSAVYEKRVIYLINHPFGLLYLDINTFNATG